MSNLLFAGGGRVWTIKFRAGPFNTPNYHGYGIPGSVDYSLGDVTKIEVPSSLRYNQWTEVGSFQGSPDRPTMTITDRMTTSRSVLWDLAQLRCPFDAQIHLGACETPTDFNLGWEKIIVYEDASATSYNTSELGAMEGGDQASITEEMEISASKTYQILRMTFKEVASKQVSEEIVAVSVANAVSCGGCGNVNDGCSTVFALSNPVGSSPGVKPQVIYTNDGFITAGESYISSFAIGKTASDGACIGDYFIAISKDGGAASTGQIHYAMINDILRGSETWIPVTTGFVASCGPQAMWSYSPLATWMVGLNGYIYFTDDPTAGVVVQSAGEATTENLNDISGSHAEMVVAVGNNNTVVYTTDGKTWTSVSGPATGANLTAVALRGDEWWVGDDNGRLWVTLDEGKYWTQVTSLKGTPTKVTKIVWVTPTVGYVATKEANSFGKIQRTISGGKWWYVMPEVSGQVIPANKGINDIAICGSHEVNTIFAGGLAANGADGILIKGFAL